MRPSLAIVTVTLNAERHLAQTLESVRRQTRRPDAFVVIDGGSQDGTLELLRGASDLVTHLESGPDRGIAEAMNKGLARCREEFVLFLHADDYLADPRSLEDAWPHLGSPEELFAFDVLYLGGARSRVRSPRGDCWKLNLKTTYFHQAVIFRRSLFERIGPYAEEYRIAMDYEFFLRARRQGARAKRCPHPLSAIRDTGIGSRTDWPSLVERFAEERRIHLRHCPGTAASLAYRGYWLLYPAYRRLRHLAIGVR